MPKSPLPTSSTYLNSNQFCINIPEKSIETLKGDELTAFYRQYQINRSRRVLVVDDNPEMRFLFIRTLIHAGYQVDSAESGSIAWNILQHRNFDLLITNSQMPKMTAVELIAKMRKQSITTPVVMSAGTSPKKELEQCLTRRSNGTLISPPSEPELLQLVSSILGTTRTLPDTEESLQRDCTGTGIREEFQNSARVNIDTRPSFRLEPELRKFLNSPSTSPTFSRFTERWKSPRRSNGCAIAGSRHD
jgi:CheY-like chemotaxis protein